MSKSWHNNDLALAPICHFHTLTACEFSFLSPLVCDSGFPLQQTGCYQVVIIHIWSVSLSPYGQVGGYYPRPDRNRETGNIQATYAG